MAFLRRRRQPDGVGDEDGDGDEVSHENSGNEVGAPGDEEEGDDLFTNSLERLGLHTLGGSVSGDIKLRRKDGSVISQREFNRRSRRVKAKNEAAVRSDVLAKFVQVLALFCILAGNQAFIVSVDLFNFESRYADVLYHWVVALGFAFVLLAVVFVQLYKHNRALSARLQRLKRKHAQLLRKQSSRPSGVSVAGRPVAPVKNTPPVGSAASDLTMFVDG